MPKVTHNLFPYGLTGKEYKFCLEYLKSNNGTQAALKAYDISINDKIHMENTACQIAAENLRKPHIVDALNAMMVENGITNENILKGIVEKTRSNNEKVALDALKILAEHKGLIKTHGTVDINVQKEEMKQVILPSYEEKARNNAENTA